MQNSLKSLLKLCEEVYNGNITEEDIEYYLFEKYKTDTTKWSRSIYYFVKPLIPREIQILLRKNYITHKKHPTFPAWPIEEILFKMINEYVAQIVKSKKLKELYRISFWPRGYKSAFCITHDIESDLGFDNIDRIIKIENKWGFVSSWNIVPERYNINWGVVDNLRDNGFEIGVHGYKHDGKIFSSRKYFDKALNRIQSCAKEWGAVGFRSESTLRNIEWLPELGLDYDSSFTDTDPYEPQPGGCCSIWPFFIGDMVELPITLPQDHTLFEILGNKDISVWCKKVDWIEQNSGLVLINVHPDYFQSDERFQMYDNFLKYMKNVKNVWHALPRDIAKWWRERSKSKLEKSANGYVINGPTSDDGVIERSIIRNNNYTNEWIGTNIAGKNLELIEL